MAGNFAAAPVLFNQTLTNANTEYSIDLPNGTTHFEMQARTNANIRFAFVTGLVAGSTAPYMTLKAGYTYSSYNLWGSQTTTLYLATPTAGTVLELIVWR